MRTFAEERKTGTEQLLMTSPISTVSIVLGKFMAVMANMIMYALILVLPFVVYGIKSGATFIYYIYMIIGVLIVPVLPMIIASTICIVLMRFVNLTKHKDAFKMATGCLSLILVVVFNIFTQGGGMDGSTITGVLTGGNDSLVGKITGVFITNKYLTYALTNNSNISGLLYMGLAIVISACLLFAFYIIGGKFYLKGIIGTSETYSSRENILKSKKADKFIKKSTPLKALAIKDLKMIFRTPQFFINCVAMLLYMPAIFGVMLISNKGISKLGAILEGSNEWNSRILVLIFIAVAMSISAGGAGITALSREGKDFIISKYIPVGYKVHLHSKIISSLCINEVCTIIIIGVLIFLGVNPLVLILGSIIAVLSVLLITLTGMYFDFKSPKLEWEDERSIMKNNWMPFLIMILMLVLGGILFIISLFIDSSIIMFILIVTVITALSYLFYSRLLVLADKVYNEN